MRRGTTGIAFCAMAMVLTPEFAATETDGPRTYTNRLKPITSAQPLLADYPEWIEPVRESARYEAPVLVDDADADLSVRAWRFSYNARGIIEIPNRLEAKATAIIVVHPWGVDDGQGWKTPEPAGVAFFCTPQKNAIGQKHTREVVNPFLQSLRGRVGMVMYSLPGNEDPIRKKMYRSFASRPNEAERREGAKELKEKLGSFTYVAEPTPATLALSKDKPVVDYIRQFRGIDSGDRFNHAGFWNLPIPVNKNLDVDPDDVVIYDAQGYKLLKEFLQKQGIRHVLLAGYCADMCVRSTTAGYQNLSQDFNVFLVGDATLATFPANETPKYATNAALSYAALDQLITQVSWVKHQGARVKR
jgi:hypothetical protein